MVVKKNTSSINETMSKITPRLIPKLEKSFPSFLLSLERCTPIEDTTIVLIDKTKATTLK